MSNPTVAQARARLCRGVLGGAIPSCGATTTTEALQAIEGDMTATVVASTTVANLIQTQMRVLSGQSIAVVSRGNCVFNGDVNVVSTYNNSIYVSQAGFTSVDPSEVNAMRNEVHASLVSQGNAALRDLADAVDAANFPPGAQATLNTAITSAVVANVTVESLNSVVINANTANTIYIDCTDTKYKSAFSINQDYYLSVGVRQISRAVLGSVQSSAAVARLGQQIDQALTKAETPDADWMWPLVSIGVVLVLAALAWILFF